MRRWARRPAERAGDLQTGVVGAGLPEPLVAPVVDDLGCPVPTAQVWFTTDWGVDTDRDGSGDDRGGFYPATGSTCGPAPETADPVFGAASGSPVCFKSAEKVAEAAWCLTAACDFSAPSGDGNGWERWRAGGADDDADVTRLLPSASGAEPTLTRRHRIRAELWDGSLGGPRPLPGPPDTNPFRKFATFHTYARPGPGSGFTYDALYPVVRLPVGGTDRLPSVQLVDAWGNPVANALVTVAPAVAPAAPAVAATGFLGSDYGLLPPECDFHLPLSAECDRPSTVVRTDRYGKVGARIRLSNQLCTTSRYRAVYGTASPLELASYSRCYEDDFFEGQYVTWYGFEGVPLPPIYGTLIDVTCEQGQGQCDCVKAADGSCTGGGGVGTLLDSRAVSRTPDELRIGVIPAAQPPGDGLAPLSYAPVSSVTLPFGHPEATHVVTPGGGTQAWDLRATGGFGIAQMAGAGGSSARAIPPAPAPSIARTQWAASSGGPMIRPRSRDRRFLRWVPRRLRLWQMRPCGLMLPLRR